jgi:hypothetical protein
LPPSYSGGGGGGSGGGGSVHVRVVDYRLPLPKWRAADGLTAVADGCGGGRGSTGGMAYQEQTEKHAFAQQQGAEAVRKLTGAPPSAVEEAHQRVEARFPPLRPGDAPVRPRPTPPQLLLLRCIAATVHRRSHNHRPNVLRCVCKRA